MRTLAENGKIELVENEKNEIKDLSEDDIVFLSRLKLKPFRDRLKASSDDGRKPFRISGHEIIADNVAGAIRLPSDKQLFIAPKLPFPNLFCMLSYVGGFDSLKRSGVQYEKDDGLFDIIAKIFASEFADFFRKGLRQQYVRREDPLSAIRSRILFSESIKKSLIGSGRLYCSYSTLSLDTLINRAVISAADALLKSTAITLETKKFVRARLRHITSGTVKLGFSLFDFKRIQLDRTTDHYRRILFLSQFILESASFNNKPGKHSFPGFLLDVAGLFEEYVEKALCKVNLEINESIIEIQSQRAAYLDCGEQIKCRPDLTFVTKKDKKVVHIADTKYKNFSKRGFLHADNADVYQILAYLILHRCQAGYLIYPAFDERTGILKTIYIPTGMGEIKIHGVCVQLDSPQNVQAQIQQALLRSNMELTKERTVP